MKLDRRKFITCTSLSAVGLALAATKPILAAAGSAELAWDLPRSSPSARGVSSRAILDFLQGAIEAGHELHSFMLARQGHVVAEGWWTPYKREGVHSLHSLTKAFTSTAVGFALSERRLGLEDRVISFFPEKLPPNVSDHLSALTVRHLLVMSSGHAKGTASIFREHDWVKAFLALPIENAPGSVFFYDNGPSYMLSAIVQKRCGQKLADYLAPRLFGPLGDHGMVWDSCPHGISTGAFGLKVTTETILKLGQLYLQKGTWNGQHLLPAVWTDAATADQIQQPATWLAPADSNLEELRKISDWYQGYGYHFWRCRYGAVRGDGAFSQFCIMMPSQQMVVAITANSFKSQDLLDLVWRYLAPAGDTVADAMTDRRLAEHLSALTLPVPAGPSTSRLEDRLNGRVFQIDGNPLGIRQVSFEFQRHECRFSFIEESRTTNVRAGLGRWVDNRLELPGGVPGISSLYESTTVPSIKDVAVAAAAAWRADSELAMHWQYSETPHHENVTCRFDGNGVEITFSNSVAELRSAGYPNLPSSKWESRPILRGRMAAYR